MRRRAREKDREKTKKRIEEVAEGRQQVEKEKKKDVKEKTVGRKEVMGRDGELQN